MVSAMRTTVHFPLLSFGEMELPVMVLEELPQWFQNKLYADYLSGVVARVLGYYSNKRQADAIEYWHLAVGQSRHESKDKCEFLWQVYNDVDEPENKAMGIELFARYYVNKRIPQTQHEIESTEAFLAQKKPK